MTALYSSQAISNYNANPPSDDGSATSTNQILWATVKNKIGDPVKTRTDSMDSALVTAFTKTLGGGSITSISTDYTVQSTDQGKLIKATASLALTMGDATAFLAPFSFGFVNLSGTTITVSGGGQTIDGNASFTVAPGAGFLAFTDGSNWNTSGLQGTLVGKQMMYGEILNGTIVQSNSSNAVTFSLKTLAGNDPSSTDPIVVAFRNSTLGTGNFVYRAVTAATTVVISAGSTMGTANAIACKIWLVLFDDAGTVRLGAINCLSGTSIYPLGQVPRASSTAEGGAGAADSAQVFYSTVAVASKAYVVLGYATYESGISTAGNWNVNPDRIQLYGPGVPLPGQPIQDQRTFSGAVLNPAGVIIPNDDTIPQNTEGAQYITQAITPTSAANILRVSGSLNASNNGGTGNIFVSLCQDSIANALAAWQSTGVSASGTVIPVFYDLLASTTSATTFKIRMGDSGGNIITLNGVSSARKFGGVIGSFISAQEIMA